VSPGVSGARSQAILIVALALGAAVFVGVTSERLPEVAATRFGAGGDPVAFMTRDTHRIFMIWLAAAVPLLVAFLPQVIGTRWPRLLNIPNRDYWIAAERRADTLASVASRTTLLAAVMILFLCFTHWLLLEANATPARRLAGGPFLAALAAFVAFMIGWIVAFRARFRR
jgi:hypothetical protein